ncbi:MAG TPA: ATP-binding protein [Ktedonobacteraceae bacterium]|nr:ATP-binding protein [Ktedonobacteraceae bacterium]
MRGDPQYLGQMLANLIENGIKYTSDIGKRASVDLACKEERWGVVRVQDDGPGISEEHLPLLFERFYHVDKTRSRKQRGSAQDHEEPGGTGLGLSIVEWIVHAHGGEIRVESRIGVGTLFEVCLPLLTGTKEEEPV